MIRTHLTLALATLAALGLGTAHPAAAQTITSAYSVVGPSDTLTAPFTSQAGTTTRDVFSGPVEIRVSGTGNALFSNVSDAFYFTASQQETSPPNGDFELAVGTPTHPFVGESDGQGGKTDAIKYDIVFINGVGPVTPGTIPAYSASNTYDFVINVPNPTGTPLTFGVNDGGYGDNSGAYTLTVTQLAPAPEPSSITALALGLLGLGALAVKAKRSPAA